MSIRDFHKFWDVAIIDKLQAYLILSELSQFKCKAIHVMIGKKDHFKDTVFKKVLTNICKP